MYLLLIIHFGLQIYFSSYVITPYVTNTDLRVLKSEDRAKQVLLILVFRYICFNYIIKSK